MVEKITSKAGKRPPANQQLGVIPKEGFMRINPVLSVLGENRTSFYQGILDGTYPPQIKLPGGRSSVWKASEIREVIELLEQGKTWLDRNEADKKAVA